MDLECGKPLLWNVLPVSKKAILKPYSLLYENAPALVCSDIPTNLEFASNDHVTTTMYIEGDEIVYTCTHNTTIMESVSCDGTGNWESPTIQCPSCEF